MISQLEIISKQTNMQQHYSSNRQLDSFEAIIHWDVFLGLTPTASIKASRLTGEYRSRFT